MFSLINTLKEHTRSTIWKLPHNSERLLLFRKHKMFKFICFLKCQLNMCKNSMNAFLKIPCCNDLKSVLSQRDNTQRQSTERSSVTINILPYPPSETVNHCRCGLPPDSLQDKDPDQDTFQAIKDHICKGFAVSYLFKS